MPRAHDIGERQQVGGQFCIRPVRAGHLHQRRLCPWHAHGFALAAVDVEPVLVRAAPGGPVVTRHGDAVAALGALAAIAHPRRDHEVTRGQGCHRLPDALDHTDEFVADGARVCSFADAPIGPEIGAADTSGGHFDHHVRGKLHLGIGPLFHPDVAGSVDDGGAHVLSLPRERLFPA
jgi:hypothetical protein